MEKQLIRRRGLTEKAMLITGSLLMAGLLSSCGQTDPPTPEEINSNHQTFELDDVTDKYGEPVKCVLYGSDSTFTNQSKSWFAFACDFDGDGVFPGESPATTTTIG